MRSGIVWEKATYGRIVVFLLAGVVALRIGAALYTAGDTDLTVWGDRDLWRAWTIDASWPVTGPEINGGLRPPGGLFYLLLGGILAVQPSVLAANLAVILLFAASLGLLGLFLGREMTPRAGLFAAAALAGSPMLTEVLKVWNPGFLLFFATVTTVFGYRYVKTGRALALGIAVAAIAVGLQIHLQIFQLAIALAVAAVIRRPCWTWRHGLAVACGLVLPYLPASVGGDSPLFASAAPVPAGAVENYVLGGFDLSEKARLIDSLLGGPPEAGSLGLSSAVDGLAALSVVGDLMAVLLTLGVLGWTLRQRSVNGPWQSMGVFAWITGIYVLVALVASVNSRHLVAALPAVAIMTGVGAECVMRRFSLSRFGWIVCVFLSCGLAARPAAIAAASFAGGEFSLSSVAAQREMAATVKAGFYADHEDFERHAALFWRPPSRPWQLMQQGAAGQMAFVYQSTPVSPVKSDRVECLAILGKDDIAGDVRADLSKSPAFSGLTPIFDPASAESQHFVYIPYTTTDGNCLKSFPNAYIPTRFESAYLSPGMPAGARQSVDAAQFVATPPGQQFPIGLELRRAGPDYLAVLHGRPLRGYTGLRFLTIVAPSLCLARDGDSHVIKLAQSTVGSPQRGTLAPWRSPRFAMPSGTYRLWLAGRDGKSPQAIQLPLGEITFPQMRVAPDSTGDVTPPAGCPAAMPGGAG